MKTTYAGLSLPTHPLTRRSALESLAQGGTTWRLAIRTNKTRTRAKGFPFSVEEIGYRESIRLTPRAWANLETLTHIILPGRTTTLELLVYRTPSWTDSSRVADSQGEWLLLAGEEAIQMARWLLDDSASHFLRFARLGRFSVTSARLSYFRSFMASNRYRHDEVLLDTSLVLELYGLRKAENIEYLSLTAERSYRPRIKRNDEYQEHHGRTLRELLADPCCHFRLGELRCVSFDQIAHFKRSRGSFEDRQDLGMMQALVAGNRRALLWHRSLYEIDLRRRLVSRGLQRLVRLWVGEQTLGFYDRWRRHRSH
ncbi:hypothetical protein ACUY1T_10015 [Billgrantia sp. Q4P2]|uniref:hypothetical protein n=1 Tax=Billgrantia sp. Q4P2 TaxID=3463857 RepID=UPI0040569774